MGLLNTFLEWYVAGAALRAGGNSADKLDALYTHALYTQMKNAKLSKKAELARQKKLVNGGKK